MTNVAKVIRANGKVEILDHKPTLKEAQAIVGGYVELIAGRDPQTGEVGQLLVDEEGKLKRRPVNLTASTYYPDGLVGDVLFLTGKRKWS